ncbi:MAG TPA: lactate utilization protein B/C [Mucilaginibacter sp.]|jgi:L-lactate dehydrogenase complex protein LldG|nr:lactate utilization protein B/C [Mucilaginibacter sp.]
MDSRGKILTVVAENQPENVRLPDISVFETTAGGSLEKFSTVLASVGGRVFYVSNFAEIARLILEWHGEELRIVSPIKELTEFHEINLRYTTYLRELANVEVAIIKACFGVAENGAVWITENEMQHRILPFICQHLAVIIDAGAIVPTMHEAYELISKTIYGFGTFIAGPSKTADIEQSLVIGAHGPRSMTVFVMNNVTG